MAKPTLVPRMHQRNVKEEEITTPWRLKKMENPMRDKEKERATTIREVGHIKPKILLFERLRTSRSILISFT